MKSALKEELPFNKHILVLFLLVIEISHGVYERLSLSIDSEISMYLFSLGYVSEMHQCQGQVWGREQDNSPTRKLTDMVFETICRQIFRQFTDIFQDNSPTLLFKVNDL